MSKRSKPDPVIPSLVSSSLKVDEMDRLEVPVTCGVRLVIRRNGNSALSVPAFRVKGGQGWPCQGG